MFLPEFPTTLKPSDIIFFSFILLWLGATDRVLSLF